MLPKEIDTAIADGRAARRHRLFEGSRTDHVWDALALLAWLPFLLAFYVPLGVGLVILVQQLLCGR
jgi:hypothetical protein